MCMTAQAFLKSKQKFNAKLSSKFYWSLTWWLKKQGKANILSAHNAVRYIGYLFIFLSVSFKLWLCKNRSWGSQTAVSSASASSITCTAVFPYFLKLFLRIPSWEVKTSHCWHAELKVCTSIFATAKIQRKPQLLCWGETFYFHRTQRNGLFALISLKWNKAIAIILSAALPFSSFCSFRSWGEVQTQARNLQSNLALKVLQSANKLDLSLRTSMLLDENQERSCKSSHQKRNELYFWLGRDYSKTGNFLLAIF